MSGILRWEAPSPRKFGDRKPRCPSGVAERWQPVADELRGRPGAWALIAEVGNGPASGLANTIKRGLVVCWEPAGDFDAATRKDAESTKVYARYVGEQS